MVYIDFLFSLSYFFVTFPSLQKGEKGSEGRPGLVGEKGERVLKNQIFKISSSYPLNMFNHI